jgi:hypothetical protein
MEEYNKLIDWLLSGDVSIQYQVKRDLLNSSKEELTSLQEQIPLKGWGRKFLSKRDKKSGLWGGGIYTPKWISTHYTLLDLKNLCIPQTNKEYRESSEILLDRLWFNNGIVAKNRLQDICVSGMLLSICGYAKIQSPKFNEIIDYLIHHHLTDGGWNCNWARGSKVSSVHTTLTVLEGIHDLESNKYYYRIEELNSLRDKAHEFLLKRNLYKSLSTGEPIDNNFLALTYPCRWRYNTLRCLDYFQSVNTPYDIHIQDAINILISKRSKNGKWKVQHRIAGQVHFDMEKTGDYSRWNTLRALRVLKKYSVENIF